MNLSTMLRMSTVWLAIPGLLLPTTVIGADLSGIAARSVIKDVALGPDGTLRGTVVGANGNRSSNIPIQFHRSGQLVAQAVTDADGNFVASKLTGGVYTVQTPGNVESFRVWTNETAPPSALNNLNISGGEIVRGQYDAAPCADDQCYGYGHGRRGILGNPWLIGLGVAAAIAIPLALNDSGSAS